jgi:hypothetical protein
MRQIGSTPRLILKWQGKLSKSEAIARYIRKHGKQGKDGKRGKSKAFADHMQKHGNHHKSKTFAHYIKKFWKKSPTAGINDTPAAMALLSKQVSQKKQKNTAKPLRSRPPYRSKFPKKNKATPLRLGPCYRS